MTHSMGSPAQTVPGLQASSKRWMVVGLLAIFALGLGLRLRLLAPGYWVNPDEGIYLQIATSPDEEFVAHAILTNAHPPLYYHLLRSLAHYDARFESLRVSSLIAGGLAMVALAGLGCVVAGRNGMVL
ncbi:MAG: hypothetical protein MUF51_03625, partial [Vicinamibacteria bacterium]|nr:hypothetical protein [Vicinamibacteria bacterium]